MVKLGSAIILLIVSTFNVVSTQPNVSSDFKVCVDSCYRETGNIPYPLLQGKPGKMGPPGTQGPKGEKGDVGTCSCNNQPSPVNDMIAGLPAKKLKVLACGVGIRQGGVLHDVKLTASSQIAENAGAANGRLDQMTSAHSYGGWRMNNPFNSNEWIQVDLRIITRITGVVIQGDYDSSTFFVTTFKMKYGNDPKKLQYILGNNNAAKVFAGNFDSNSYVINTFDEPVSAIYFRIYPATWSGQPTLRFELLTC